MSVIIDINCNTGFTAKKYFYLNLFTLLITVALSDSELIRQVFQVANQVTFFTIFQLRYFFHAGNLDS